MIGAPPKGEIDHIDGDASNNRWVNLRDVDKKTNIQNVRRARSHNKSTGVLGVVYEERTKKFRAGLTFNGKRYWFGRFTDVDQAHQAYLEGKRKLHAGCTL